MSDDRQPVSEPGPPAPRVRGAVDRGWSVRTLVAAAVTSVALGGVGGAALAKAADGGSADGRPGRGGFGGPPGMVTGQQPGQQQPPTRRPGVGPARPGGQ